MEDETQVFTLRVVGVQESRTLLSTSLKQFDETYEIRAEHPAAALDELTHEVEWGILDSYAGFAVYVAAVERPEV